MIPTWNFIVFIGFDCENQPTDTKIADIDLDSKLLWTQIVFCDLLEISLHTINDNIFKLLCFVDVH